MGFEQWSPGVLAGELRRAGGPAVPEGGGEGPPLPARPHRCQGPPLSPSLPTGQGTQVHQRHSQVGVSKIMLMYVPATYVSAIWEESRIPIQDIKKSLIKVKTHLEEKTSGRSLISQSLVLHF